jgi:hypothetical protein
MTTDSSDSFRTNVRRGREFEEIEKKEWEFIPSERRAYECVVDLLDAPGKKGASTS